MQCMWYNVYIIPAPERSGVRIRVEHIMCRAHGIIHFDGLI